tara:strand:- start:87 stop:1277 length:1191 start_codon:yes stop_codon:yes gene_type:complete
MKSISFIVTNFNTEKYTEWCYNSIRKNLGYVHEIVMLDDGSSDGTWELLQKLKSTDVNMKIHRNKKNIGIAYAYNKMVELASNEIVCMLHSDMYVPSKFDEIMLKYMEDYDFITPLRVEPNVGYPESVDKFLIDFGTSRKNFKEFKFSRWHEKNIKENKGRVEQRMFFPWMTTKTLYNKVGGNDELFLKYMVDDDDFYLRIKMSGAKYTQLFETAVYHMPSKSVRMREDDLKVEVDEQYEKSIRNFVRKWGCWPGKVWDNNRDMVIPKKYDIGFLIKNCNKDIVKILEPWCSKIFFQPKDYQKSKIQDYINEEQKKTTFDLTKKFKTVFDEESYCDIMVEFDVNDLNEQRFQFLQMLSEIIAHSGEVGDMTYDVFFLKINSLKTRESENLPIKLEK